jgi:signal transduction histidine kinase
MGIHTTGRFYGSWFPLWEQEIFVVINARQLTWNLGPVSNWQDLKSHDHLAQFYESDTFLLESLRKFVSAGIQAGETVIVIATARHRAGLAQLLLNSETDLEAAKASGQYLSLDASTMLNRFMSNGKLDEQIVKDTVSSILSRRIDGRPVRVFGEMVALLWESGNYDAAIELERIWNELKQEHPFSLYCAYPISAFGARGFAQPLLDVCAMHTHVIPAESYSNLSTEESRLRAILELQQKARTLEAEIAERKLAEENLQALKDELERQVDREKLARADAEHANRMKDEFLATVSHELRTPLNAIIGWAHILRIGSLDEATTIRALEAIDRNARAQAQLVEDILDVARVMTGKLPLKLATVDVATVINTAIDSVHLAAQAKEIKLIVKLDPVVLQTTGDAARLQQVVWNLLSNAIKFTPSGGHIEIATARVDGSIQIEVRDTGMGISSELLPFVFDRFRQGDGTITRRHGGLGLGLAIARHLVELHGGTISANSPGPEKGSKFTIALPATQTESVRI